ncbi:MAG TPA: replicative DNA helicase [Balneolales bacterium]|nr:replicative DNA helicase [Balneolales bacterium]
MPKDSNGSDYNNKKNYKKEIDLLEDGGRIPPQALEIEEAVLGGMLIDHEAASIALQILKPEDFYKPANRHVFEAILKLYERDNPLDIITVENELRDQNLLDICGGPGYLTQLTRSVSSAANIEYHAQIIAEKAIKRNLILTCNEIIKQSYDTTSDPFDLLDQAEQKIFEISNTKTRIPAKAIGNILKDTLDYLVEIRGKADGLTGVPSSLDVDKLTAGWQPGDLIIIAARPSMGKTAFVLSSARNAALFPDKQLRTNVAIFSLEMSDQSLVQRLLTMEARINAQMARSGKLNDQDFEQLVEAAGRLVSANIFIDDTPGISVMELRSKCRRLKNEHDIGLVIVDYLQLMTGGSSDRNREQEIAYISRGLKALAKELKVPVVALSQLSRAVEQRGGNKRPQLSDLRESGSIEQDADVVCFLYRPEYYGILTDEEGQSTAGISELIIGKQRNGPVGTVRLQFIKDYARFENLSSAYNKPYDNGNGNGNYSNMLPEVGPQDTNNQEHDSNPDILSNNDDEDAPF